MSSNETKPVQAEVKKVPFVDVDPFVIGQLRLALSRTTALRDDITEKMERLAGWRDDLKKLTGNNNDDRSQEIANVDKGIEAYLGLLMKVFLELSVEIDSVSPYVEDQPPAELSVAPGNEHLSASEILKHKIDSMRKEAKAVKKDLQVSFSRYEHGLGNQLQYLKQREVVQNS